MILSELLVLSQPAYGPVHEHADVDLGPLGHGGNLAVAEALGPQVEDLALGDGQLLDGGVQPFREVLLLGRFGRIRLAASQRRRFVLQPLGPAPQSQEVDGLVAADGKQPGVEPVLELVGRLVAKAEEDVLDGIGRRARVAEKPDRKAGQPGLVLLEGRQDQLAPVAGICLVHPDPC
jgi:hypothetical protein